MFPTALNHPDPWESYVHIFTEMVYYQKIPLQEYLVIDFGKTSH